MISVEQLVALAKEVESEDPIDWGMLSVDEDTAYRIIASQVIELYNTNDQITMLASITKLVVENFVLNLKLQGFKSSPYET
jgi:hypothetical protein